MPLPQRSEYSLLTDHVLNRAAEAGIPVSGAFELTSRCNLQCRMCYIRHEATDAAARAQELSAAEWLGLAQDATSAGMVFLLLTGGEVLLRPDFPDLYEPLTELGLNLTLFTNGTLVTPALARLLGRRPPNRTEITLYGASPQTYGDVTGHPEAFAQALAIEEEAAFVDHSIFHLDGVGAFRFLDDLLAIRDLDMIQLTPGAGEAPNHTFVELFKKILAAGKGIQVSGAGLTPDRVKQLHRELGPKGPMYMPQCRTREEAEELLEWLERNT